MRKAKLELVLTMPDGKQFIRAISFDEMFSLYTLSNEKPNFEFEPMPFDRFVERIKNRQFRKDVFIDEARRLGHQLAEYLEDAEGWHGEQRRESVLAHIKEQDQ